METEISVSLHRHSESPTLLKCSEKNDYCFRAASAANSLRALRETFNMSLVVGKIGIYRKGNDIKLSLIDRSQC